MKRRFYLPALAVLSLAAASSAYAAKPLENDALAIDGAKIGLTQAITSAEQHVGGKASRAEYEKHKGRWVFDVEIVKGKEVTDVKVDATSGKVIAASLDEIDHDDELDKAD